jgi:hypothetical protein
MRFFFASPQSKRDIDFNYNMLYTVSAQSNRRYTIISNMWSFNGGKNNTIIKVFDFITYSKKKGSNVLIEIIVFKTSSAFDTLSPATALLE